MNKKRKPTSEGGQDSKSRPLLLPLLPLRDVVALPGAIIPIFVSSNTNISAIDYALEGDMFVGLSLQADPGDEEPSKKNILAHGVVAKISSSVRLANGVLKIKLQVLQRLKITAFLDFQPFVKVRVRYLDEKTNFRLNKHQQSLIEDVKSKFSVLSQYDESLEEMSFASQDMFEPGELADLVASSLPLEVADGQKLVEELDPFVRLEQVRKLLNSQLDLVGIKERISNRVQEEIDKSEHEQLLREQLKQIKAELGETIDDEEELSSLKEQLERIKMPPGAKNEAKRQLRRLQQLHPDTSESALARTYLDWIIDLPWSEKTKDRLDLKEAAEILDEDHYGLEKTKERILDFLGVRKLKSELRGPILLLVGPPGVGKTSMGRSIARALGRKFVRISVGGLRDEAELRGHRRTYVGALPGKIIQALKNAQSKNPVIMLDELDKIGSDYRGDPASVLLEILDPEQNKNFEDHYLNVPFDLSEVMFIATANIVDSIPSPLLDRVEVIEIPGYTTEEKLEIAKRYLLPRSRTDNGLERKPINLAERSINYLIEGYTRESGVRELGRVIDAVYRKIARQVVEGGRAPRTVTPKMVDSFLGPVRYTHEGRPRANEIGVVTGLAWTAVGGELMQLEVAMTKGKGALSLTGQMGDVMKESAMAALTYVQSNAERLGINPEFHENNNIHIHVPQGAIPKDGPSAGTAMATALVSLLTGRAVSRNVAMTGEITLRGAVLAVGGLREKALAALRAGIPIVIIPKANERELVDFPKYLLDKVKFVPVETIDEALSVAFVEKRVTLRKKDVIRL